MEKAKAMVLTKFGSPDYLEVQEFPVPEPADDAIVARVKMCGVCGTDTHVVYGRLKLPLPTILGHEWFGVVEKLGSNVKTDFTGKPLNEGDYIATCGGACGKCWFCKNTPGRTNLCDSLYIVGLWPTPCDQPPHLFGGFAEYVYVDTTKLPVFKFPPGLSENEMVLVEPMAVATRTWKRAIAGSTCASYAAEGWEASQTIAIQGLGPIGQCHVTTALVHGVDRLILIDLMKDRLEEGKKLADAVGAETLLINLKEVPNVEDRVKMVKDFTYGVGADIVIEATGAPPAFAEAFKLVRRGGTIVEMGHFTDTGSIQVNPHIDLCNKDVQVFGSWAYPGFEYKTAIAVMAKAKKVGIPFGNILKEVNPLEELPNSIRRQEEKKVPGKIAIKP